MKDAVKNVADFHKKFGIGYEGPPRVLDREALQFRVKFMREEIDEYESHMMEALNELTVAPTHRDDANLVHHLAEALDALVDTIYVAVGTAHLQGLPLVEGWARVQAANMAKAIDPTQRDATAKMKAKIIKPEGWEAPHHEDLVEAHAHRSDK